MPGLEGIAAGLLLIANATGIFTVLGWEILLDSSVFEVRGMCYQPTPIGEDVSAGPLYRDYCAAWHSNLWDRDFAHLWQMEIPIVSLPLFLG